VLGLPPLTKGTSLAAFANTLRGVGAPVDSALKRAKLPLLYDERLDAWLSYHAVRQFVADLAAREGLADLGSRAAQSSLQAGIHPPLRAAVYSAPTLFSALRALSRMVHHQITGLHIWVESYGSNLRLCHAHTLGPDFPGYELNESYRTCQFVAIIRRFCGPEWLPTRVITRCVQTRKGLQPRGVAFADERVPVQTHPDYGAVEFQADLAWRPNLQPIACSPTGRTPDPDLSVAAVLRSSLSPYLLEGNQSLNQSAEILNMTTRELQRALAKEHTSFKKERSLARLEGALIELRDPELPLVEVATKLGYSEQSAFSRAFRFWMGISPSTYRARLLACPGNPDLPSPPH
jgi:AraC-like DNA-binding protein